MWNASLDESEAMIKIARRHINYLRYGWDLRWDLSTAVSLWKKTSYMLLEYNGRIDIRLKIRNWAGQIPLDLKKWVNLVVSMFCLPVPLGCQCHSHSWVGWISSFIWQNCGMKNVPKESQGRLCRIESLIPRALCSPASMASNGWYIAFWNWGNGLDDLWTAFGAGFLFFQG